MLYGYSIQGKLDFVGRVCVQSVISQAESLSLPCMQLRVRDSGNLQET